MAYLIYGKSIDDPLNKMLLDWAGRRITHAGSGDKFGLAIAVGMATGPRKTDHLMAVCVFHEYRPAYYTCQASTAAVDPRFATRATIRQVLAVPFIQYRVNKVYTATPHTAKRVIAFNKAIGFIEEATLADHFGPGIHAVICRMRAKDYEAIYLKRTRKPHPARERPKVLEAA